MLKLSSWNVNGIRACLQKQGLENLLANFNPDIICIQETKAQPDQVDLSSLNYQAVWNSAEKKGYSGTLILTRLKPREVVSNFAKTLADQFPLKDRFGDSNLEGRILTLEFDNFYLVTVYTPNSKGDLGRLNLRQKAWDVAFKKHCANLKASKPVLISGDFNVAHQPIDLARPEENVGKHGFTQEERQGFDNLLKEGFVDVFRHFYPDKTEAYTWWTFRAGARLRNIGWRLDYWLCSQDWADKLEAISIESKILGSDHCPINLTIDI